MHSKCTILKTIKVSVSFRINAESSSFIWVRIFTYKPRKWLYCISNLEFKYNDFSLVQKRYFIIPGPYNIKLFIDNNMSLQKKSQPMSGNQSVKSDISSISPASQIHENTLQGRKIQ